MKLTIAYLYYDLLNLYGEKGNLKEIIKELENQQIDYEIKYLSINDSLIFKDSLNKTLNDTKGNIYFIVNPDYVIPLLKILKGRF